MADSIREALTSAFDKAEADPTENAQDTSDLTEATESTQDASDSNVDTLDSPSGKDETDAGSTSAPSAEASPSPTPPADTTPAPVSWSTEERAAWATVPKPARDAIMRREGEMNRALQASSSARQRVAALESIAAPYKPLLDSYGVQVEQVIPSLLATRAALEVGTPQQKAQLVANLCADFGIDIQVLDNALSSRYANGTPTPQYGGGPPAMQSLQNHPDLQGLFGLAAQFKEAQTARAREVIATVEAQPHYEAVRFTMADLIDKAKEVGKTLDINVAYNLAAQMHGYAAAPAPQGSVSDAARTLANARRAASSVGGAPRPSPGTKPGEGSLRDELLRNMNAKR